MSSENLHTQTKILNAALNLLQQGPAAKTRMSDIAKAAGISRQAVYLHYPSRADLMIAAARHLDQVKEVDARLADSRAATSGAQRLRSFIDAWGHFMPEIWGLAKAFLAMRETDEAAAAAWDDRMQAVRHGCQAAVSALDQDDQLSSAVTVKQGTDLLWALLSIETWRRLTHDCGWSQAAYIDHITRLAEVALLNRGSL
ncbi:MAG: TetR/AcrR family transcriptional regulator [Pseudomonadota bacterium]